MPSKEVCDKGRVISRVRAHEKKAFEREHEMLDHNRILDNLYEKIYFHEIDGRDKVAQRLQLPLVTFLALAGFIGHMLQNVQRSNEEAPAIWFWSLLGLAVTGLTVAAFYFVRSVIGKTYSYLPDPDEWSKHHKECVELYNDYSNADALAIAAIQKNIVATYIKCGTKNGAINAEKASYVFIILRSLVGTALFTFAAYGVFFFGKLDKNLTHLVQKIEISNPVIFREDSMTNQKPPPPPPPPPTREIREDRGRPVPPKPPQQPARPPQRGSENGK
jgi:hypothetical protein